MCNGHTPGVQGVRILTRAAKQIRKAVIPVAGLGTRFLPATKSLPKEMLPIVDKPLVQYAVEEAVSAGINQIVFVTGRNKRTIEDHFDVSFELEVMLQRANKAHLLPKLREISEMATFCYVRQQEARGLGHAVLCAKPLIDGEDFVVLLADEILHAPVSALQQMLNLYQIRPGPMVGLQAVEQAAVSQYGIVDAKQITQTLYRIKGMVEKPSLEDAPSNLSVVGRYILPHTIFAQLEKTTSGVGNEIQLTDALKALAGRMPVYGVCLEGERFDAGDKAGFLKATVALGLSDPQVGQTLRTYLKQLD